MPPSKLPKPEISISKQTARRFLLAHHYLWPSHQLVGKNGVRKYIDHVGSIQFDPINIVGRNPDLVLQSRVVDYRPEFLNQLLYEDRHLIDGWDKMACIYNTTDWPYFSYRRKFLRENPDPRKPPDTIINDTLDHIRKRGPLSSLDFKDYEKVDWHWGPTKAVRAAMEYLYSRGFFGVHHRINNRRYFDIIEKLLPEELLNTPNPFSSTEEYQDWHVIRRIGSLGLAQTNTGEYWMGILGLSRKERLNSLTRLIEQGKVVPIGIDDVDNNLFIRHSELSTLERAQKRELPDFGAAFIAPLDNFLWDRGLIEKIFDFRYRWEVYKPKTERQFGYYVLPVIYGDQFIARLDPAFDKKKRILTLQNWWWEKDVEIDQSIQTALEECLKKFCRYLNTTKIILGDPIQKDSTLNWIKTVHH